MNETNTIVDDAIRLGTVTMLQGLIEHSEGLTAAQIVKLMQIQLDSMSRETDKPVMGAATTDSPFLP